MSDRIRLPYRRECGAIAFEFGGINYVGKISRDGETGAVMECFLDTTSVRPTSPVAFIAHALAISASIALQHGATADELRHSLPKVDLPNGGTEAGDPLGKLLALIA